MYWQLAKRRFKQTTQEQVTNWITVAEINPNIYTFVKH